MKNKKEFFGVLFSVLICVFLVFLGVYAATTVGNNVTVGGTITVSGSSASTELTVLGTASISEDLWASGSFQFGAGEGQATASYSRLGSANSGHTLLDADDLLITGLLEVDDTAFFDAAASVALDLSVEGGDFSVSGDVTITGNDLTFGNAGTIVNTSADKITITEAEVLFSAIASVSTDLWVDRIYGTNDTGYLTIGDGGGTTTGHSLDSEDDLLVTGDLEVDGTAYFDGTVSVSSSGLLLDEGITIETGVGSKSGSCTRGSVYFRSDPSTIDELISVCDVADEWTTASISSGGGN